MSCTVSEDHPRFEITAFHTRSRAFARQCHFLLLVLKHYFEFELINNDGSDGTENWRPSLPETKERLLRWATGATTYKRGS